MRPLNLNSQEIFKERRKNLWSRLNESEITGLMILKYQDIYYLTGFYGKDSNSILIMSPQKTYLLVNFIYHEDAMASAGNSGIEIILYKGSRIKKAADVISSINTKEIAVGDFQIDHTDFVKLGSEIKRSKKKLITHRDLIGSLRSIKDTHEIKSIGRACSITDSVFSRLIKYSKKNIAGHNELSLANEIEKLCIKNGGYGPSFDFVIASGPDASRPHHSSSHKNISGEMIIMDFGTVYNRYCSDITRTVFLEGNTLDKELRKIYGIVLEAQLKAIDACREGIRCDELDSIARRHIRDAGYGEQFGHGLGHGVGLEVHEGPYLTGKNNTVLKTNMVITIEPGIYIPGLGGVRIEDMVVVEKNGCRNLYTSKKDFTFLS